MKSSFVISIDQYLERSDSDEAIEILEVSGSRIEITSGYGPCKSCNCPCYQPNNPKNEYCKKCSHHWSRHRE